MSAAGGSFDAITVEAIIYRDGGYCAFCGMPVGGMRGRDWSIHHRRPRGSGGTSTAWIGEAANGVLVHGSGTTGCHGEIEKQRRRSIADGFLILMGVATAETTPIRHAVHGLVRLRNDGSWERAGGDGEEKDSWVTGR